MEHVSVSLTAQKILIVEDDHDMARFAATVLQRHGFETVHVDNPQLALTLLATSPFDLVLSDLRLPLISGVDFAASANVIRPGVPFIVMTAHATMDAAIDALRVGAYDFLQKPVSPAQLIRCVEHALARHSKTSRRPETVLAIGAHPDDVEIGVAGTLLAHRRQGDRVILATLTAGEGGGDTAQRRLESEAAAKLLDAELICLDFEDTKISSGNPTVAALESLIAANSPTIVYTHTDKDVHQDHRATHSATLVAARRVQRLYCYESPSTTVDFRPTRFVSIDDHLDQKLKAIEVFRSQTARAEYLAPDLLAATARYWGRQAEGRHAEPFEVVRERMPADPVIPLEEILYVA